jgi:hypothetical protein
MSATIKNISEDALKIGDFLHTGQSDRHVHEELKTDGSFFSAQLEESSYMADS